MGRLAGGRFSSHVHAEAAQKRDSASGTGTAVEEFIQPDAFESARGIDWANHRASARTTVFTNES